MQTALRGCAGAAVEGGLGRNHSLATGDVGTLLALAEAADALGDPLLRARASGWTSAVLASVRELGARCAGPGAVEVPGVLAGLAGMGLGWLRLRALEREPPAAGVTPRASPSRSPGIPTSQWPDERQGEPS
jgi:lantibiotic modifying enzyme